jgi:predicted histidine transporter YuiF (NhaC family)
MNTSHLIEIMNSFVNITTTNLPNLSFGIFVSSVVILSGVITIIFFPHKKDIEYDTVDIEQESHDMAEIRLKSLEHNMGRLAALYTNLEKVTKNNEKSISNIQNFINESSE